MLSLFITSLLLIPAPQDQDKGKLEQFEEPFKDRKKKTSKQPSSTPGQEVPVGPTHLSYDDEDDEPDWCEELIGDVLVAVITYPFIDHGLRFAAYPYEGHADPKDHRAEPGYFLGSSVSNKWISFEARTYALRVDHNLWAWGAAGDLRVGTNLGLRADFSQYREDIGGRTESLELQEYEVNLSLGEGSRRVNVSLGLGAGVLRGSEAHVGMSLQAAVEWYPVQPVSFRGHASVIGFSNATLNDLSAEVRIHWNRLALSLGIRSLINSRGDDLTGPMFGLEIWF